MILLMILLIILPEFLKAITDPRDGRDSECVIQPTAFAFGMVYSTPPSHVGTRAACTSMQLWISRSSCVSYGRPCTTKSESKGWSAIARQTDGGKCGDMEKEMVWVREKLHDCCPKAA